VSKAGLETLVKTYAHEVADGPVRVNLADPGAVRTQLRAKAFPGEDPDTLPPPEDVVPMFLDLLSPDYVHNGRVVTFRDWQKKRESTKTDA
jgi:NAD(P)-dependent dehydrogenase (short-subunit alcohol dehydrogenase family)